jgi:hypothetical protein
MQPASKALNQALGIELPNHEYAPWLFAARLPSSIDALDQNILQSLPAIIFSRCLQLSSIISSKSPLP